MSRPFVPGAAEIYVGTGNAEALEYLGSTQGGVTITYRRGQEPVIADKGGPTVPVDMQQMGIEAFVRAKLALFNWSILVKVIPDLLAGTFGAIAAQQVGTPLLLSNKTMRLLIYWPNGGDSLYPSMPSARNFADAFVMDYAEPVGTKYQVIPIVWHCLAAISGSDGSGTLVNTSTTGKGSAD